MNADPKKPIEVQDCIGPRPEYFVSGDRGHLFCMSERRPGPLVAIEMKVFAQRHRAGVFKAELLQLAWFWMN